MSEHFNPGFPVFVYQEDMELPTDGTYFVVAGNGLWLRKDTGIVSAFIPVESISVLPDLNAQAWVYCNLPPIPARLVWRVKKFFQMVVEKMRAESGVVLYYNKDIKEYRVHVPQQEVHHSGMSYQCAALANDPMMGEFLRVGTIHSHCDFSAFHSATDRNDEEDFDGLHCTFGHNDQDVFSISASVVVNGNRSLVDPAKYLEGIILKGKEKELSFYVLPEPDPDWNDGLEDWLTQVSLHGNVTRSKFNKGDYVNWAGDLTTVHFKKTCGAGPFRVDCVEDGYLTILTQVGLARFSDKLFKHERDAQ